MTVSIMMESIEEPSLRTSESTIVRMTHFTVLLTIVFTVEAGKRCLSDESVRSLSHVRISSILENGLARMASPTVRLTFRLRSRMIVL